MKTLGLLGGMSWESTAVYYQIINRRVRDKVGGLHSSKCIVYSFDFAEIEKLQQDGDWDQAGQLMSNAAASLMKIGADAIVICTNTMHKLAPAVEAGSGLPVLHIADATAERIKQSNLTRIGLLGTRYTMEQDFYKSRLIDKYNLQVVIPDKHQREVVNSIIYDELCNGIVTDKSRSVYVEIIKTMATAGAEAIILGCTEIGLLVRHEDVPLPIFDTTVIHAEMAADWAVSSHDDMTK